MSEDVKGVKDNKDAKDAKNAKNTKNVKKANKNGFMSRTKSFFRGVWSELKKVYWPTQKQVVLYTGIVLGAIFVIGFAIWIVDSGLSFLLSKII